MVNKDILIKTLFTEKYYCEPYDPDFHPIMTILLCSRITRGLGGNADILKYLGSFLEYWKPAQQDNTEILLKLDIDDDYAIKNLILNNRLEESFPTLHIRPIIYGRWDGRASLNYHYMFLFSKRNPFSTFITFASDDAYYTADMLELVLLKNLTTLANDYSIFVQNYSYLDTLRPLQPWRESHSNWALTLTEPYPVVSAHLIEICGNMGWQVNIDNWLSLLNVIMYQKYRIDLYKPIKKCVIRRTEERPGLELGKYSSFNKEMYVDDSTPPQSDYYYTLVEKQVDNIYHDMKMRNYILQ